MSFTPVPWRWPPLIALCLCALSCTSTATVEPAATEIEAVLAYVDNGVDAEVADCIVGLASREFEIEQILSGTLTGDDALLLDEMARSCEDAVAAINDEDLADRSSFDVGPFNVGDDAYLDELWFGCEAGRGADCDQLWEEAPVGSIYESFGVSCGDRPEILDCTLEMDGPNRTPAAAR